MRRTVPSLSELQSGAPSCFWLLLSWRLRDGKRSKQSITFIVWPCREEQSSCQSICAGRSRTMAELQRPKPVNLDRLSRGRMQQTDGFEFTSLSKQGRIESMNTSVTEVAHEQVTAEPAKIRRR